MKADRKSSKKESTIPIVESPEVKHAPLGADEFGTPILPTLTRAVEPAPATEPAPVTVETTVPVIEKKAGKAKAAKPAPVPPVSKLRVTDDELQVFIISSETYKKDGAPRRKTPELALAILFDSKLAPESLERLNSPWIDCTRSQSHVA